MSNIDSKKHDCIMLGCDISKKDWEDYIYIIDKDDIYDTEDNYYGIETEPHVTLLWGIHSDEVDKELAELMIKSISLLELDVENISVFENEDYDVVKFDIIPSDILLQIRKIFERTLPNTQTFPDYNPHMTISYVKTGKGKKYAKKFNKPLKFSFNKGIYSDYEYKKKYFDLKPLNESLTGMIEDINTAIRLNIEGVKKSKKAYSNLRSYMKKEFKHIKQFEQFVNKYRM